MLQHAQGRMWLRCESTWTFFIQRWIEALEGSSKGIAILKIDGYIRVNYTVNRTTNQLSAYSDADWGNNLNERRSVSGVSALPNGEPVVSKP